MSDFKIPAGRHLAKVIDYGLSETKAGDQQVMVKLKLSGDGSEITWYGSLKEGKAQEITFDTLQRVLQMQGDDLLALEGGAGSQVLNETKDVEITVAHEEYQGKTQVKVKWINDVGGFTKKKLDVQATSKLKSLNAAFKARRKETGATAPTRDSELDF